MKIKTIKEINISLNDLKKAFPYEFKEVLYIKTAKLHNDFAMDNICIQCETIETEETKN